MYMYVHMAKSFERTLWVREAVTLCNINALEFEPSAHKVNAKKSIQSASRSSSQQKLELCGSRVLRSAFCVLGVIIFGSLGSRALLIILVTSVM